MENKIDKSILSRYNYFFLFVPYEDERRVRVFDGSIGDWEEMKRLHGEVYTIPERIYKEYVEKYDKEPTPKEMLDYIMVMGYFLELKHEL